ncbi:hypothetical protein [Collimonas sp. OK412]|uniref:hypothetical protein n=1 Tax=Collimonas sp. (strain OK412) TaxID=1801619 RepID=UPI00111349EE|nr:hypothetical protein [Collimonas sp. OK412]
MPSSGKSTPGSRRRWHDAYIQYDVHVTTIEDSSIQKAAKGWRTVTQEEGDLFIVEVDPGVPSSQFELPFSQVDFFADEQQKRISQRDPSMKL